MTHTEQPITTETAACSDWPAACQHSPAHDNGRLTPEPRSTTEQGAGYTVAAWMRGDGTGYFIECPVCHFYRVPDPGQPCRRIGCDGIAVKVEVRVVRDGGGNDA